jgi:hypothetical protein
MSLGSLWTKILLINQYISGLARSEELATLNIHKEEKPSVGHISDPHDVTSFSNFNE